MAKKSIITNHGETDYVETFHGKKYIIPAGSTLELSRHEAIEFLGNFPGDNVEKPLTIKHLAVTADAIVTGFQCHLCGTTLNSQKMLDRHTEDVHEKDEKVQKLFVCPFCDVKGIRVRKDLIAHIKTHKEQSVDKLIDALE